MTDVFSKTKRSRIMASIKSKNTKLDLAMLRLLENTDLPFQKYPAMYGKPDFLVGTNLVIFCDSSFWHGKDWIKLKRKLEYGNNSDYWVNHIAKNRARDKAVTKQLEKEGFRVLRFWDSEVFKNPENVISRIRSKFDESCTH